MIDLSEMLHCYHRTVFIQTKLEATSCSGAIFLTISKKLAMKWKMLGNTGV